MSRHVSPLAAVRLVARTILRQLVTKGRVTGLGAMSVLIGVVIWLVGRGSDDGYRALRGVADLGLVILVPVVALVIAGAALGDPREDGTLVYLWLRPIDRWPIVVGAYLAAVTVSIPLTVPFLAVAAALGGGGATDVVATVVASTVGVLAYAALFVLLSLFVRNAVIWGLAYILAWEGLVVSLAKATSRMSIRSYVTAVVERIADTELQSVTWSLPVALGAALGAAVVALALAAWRLTELDVT